MFTGIIGEVGRVERIDSGPQGARLRISAICADELGPGDSIAVDGVCLTATELEHGAVEVDAMNQTLSLTTLGELEPQSPVNLELPLRAGDPLGGHIVQGHVDAVASVTGVVADGIARRLHVEVPPQLRRLLVEHGSITLAGVSVTVAGLLDDGIEVSLIPETLARTTLGGATTGTPLNLEVDVIARYVERLMSPFSSNQ